MSTLIFLTTIFTTFFVMAVLWYAQFSAYPQFKWLNDIGTSTFLTIHGRYVNNLWVSTYGPIILNLVSAALLLVIRPAVLPLWIPVALNSFNGLGIAATFGLAVPIHIRMDREQHYTRKDLDDLLRANALRLFAVIVNSAVLLYALVRWFL